MNTAWCEMALWLHRHLLLLYWIPHITWASSSPHIIYILADDLGWNDVSFHGSDQIPTPNIDSLAYNGVILNKHYAQPLCTPSRAALLTGKYAIHTGQHWAIGSSEKTGLPETEKILPQYLKEIGYATHMVGKWHLGFYKKQLTPLERGFDSHFGYWSGAISYYDHIFDEYTFTKSGFWGHDMRRNYSSAWDVVGQYATDLFTEEAVRVIENHPQDKPLFLYLAHLATHAGNEGKLLEAPQEEINRFSHISNPNRRTFAAMLSKLDQSVGEVIGALGRKDMLHNSIIVFVSDNGAPNIGTFNNWGSNFPFRGQKATLWEGGVRVPALVWSPRIAEPSRVSSQLMHITDWLPTLLSAAGYNMKLTDIDGLDQWHSISNGFSGPRETLLMDIYETGQMYSLYMGSFKYIKGACYPYSNEKSEYLNLNTIISKNQPTYNLQNILKSKTWTELKKFAKYSDLQKRILRLRKEATVTCQIKNLYINCDSQNPCLFNLANDPCEQQNIAKIFPLLTAHMEMMINKYKPSCYPEVPTINDPESNPDNFNGTWSSWVTEI